MPQRHSKNAGVMGSEALTYSERKGLGFGTVKERLGKVGVSAYVQAASSRLGACAPCRLAAGWTRARLCSVLLALHPPVAFRTRLEVTVTAS